MLRLSPDQRMRTPCHGVTTQRKRSSVAAWPVLSALVMIGTCTQLMGADPKACQQKLIAGQYVECIDEARQAIENRAYGDDWPVLETEAELAIGRYTDALKTINAGLDRYSWSVRLRLLGYHVNLLNNEPLEALKYLNEIDVLASRSPWRYTDADDLVALGQTALLLGADARKVLEGFFDRAKKYDVNHRAPYLALAQLALDKSDFQLAADVLEEAVRKFPDDPDILFGLARVYASSNPEKSANSFKHALQANPRHVPSLLFQAERLIDAEQYDDARTWIEKALAVNSKHAEAWAYRAVLAHLEHHSRKEQAYRAMALSSWNRNPAVDHLIGRKLSQKYRFAEGAAYQRRALQFNPNYLPAQIQLAQDLLRLGEEREGWKLANAVSERDGYDVAAYNLVELHGTIDAFRTLEDDRFLVRMDRLEADLYGDRVLRLLNRAYKTLVDKYGVELPQKITVEVFPDQNDFAVRTFGMPAVSGYLGVCFGRVITANSPVSQRENPTSWKAVLWHEFCHVVTLQMTHNRIPRWLSEGISVYEEQRENRAWGQQMNPRYREIILDGGLTPISRLSSAFLSPPTPAHLQFAYYESSLVVEYLVDTYGLDVLLDILHDLRADLPLKTALERHADPIERLEAEFDQFARERANSLAPNVDWMPLDMTAILTRDGKGIEQWIRGHANHLGGLTVYADMLLRQQQWKKAIDVLEQIIRLYPNDTSGDNAYEKLAAVYRQLNAPEQERAVLEQYVKLDADAVRVFVRLVELAKAAKDWASVIENAERAVAVDPLAPVAYRALAEAAEQLGDQKREIDAYRKLVALEPDDPAQVHYRLACLLHARGDASAKRHLLMALEEAPRFRPALELLLEMTRSNPPQPSSENESNIRKVR